MTKITQVPLVFRRLEAEDLNFIYPHWLNSYRTAPFSQLMPAKYFKLEHKKIITSLLTKAKTIVAVDPGDLNLIYGFMTHETTDGYPVIHYLYVKEAFRGLGIAKALLSEIGIHSRHNQVFTSHMTHIARDCLEKRTPLPDRKKNMSGKRKLVKEIFKEGIITETQYELALKKYSEPLEKTHQPPLERHEWIYFPYLITG